MGPILLFSVFVWWQAVENKYLDTALSLRGRKDYRVWKSRQLKKLNPILDIMLILFTVSFGAMPRT